MSVVRSPTCGFIAILLAVPMGVAAPVSSSNILVSTNSVLYEYTTAGVFVQSFQIPDSAGTIPNSDTARDIAMKTGSNDVRVYNGTFTASMSTLDSSASSWTHQSIAGLSTVNNVSYGGIAVGGQYVFVTDMATAGAGAPQGIVRFDSDGGSTRFATGISPEDLNVGQNALLYALESDVVHVYDADSMAFQQSIDLDLTIGSGDYRSVAANAVGQMFVVDWSGNLYKTDSGGGTLLSVSLSGIAASTSLIDVDVSDSGTVVVGDFGGGVTITDESFTSPTSLVTIGSSATFVAVASNPPVGVPISPVAVFVLAGLLAAVSLVTLRRLRACRSH